MDNSYKYFMREDRQMFMAQNTKNGEARYWDWDSMKWRIDNDPEYIHREAKAGGLKIIEIKPELYSCNVCNNKGCRTCRNEPFSIARKFTCSNK